MTPGQLFLIVRRDQVNAFVAAWPDDVQIVVDRRQAQRRVKENPRIAIERRKTDRRQRAWVEAALTSQGAVLVRP
jgi:hypothetical protein